MVYAMLKNREDTEEVIQDASLKVIESLICEENEKGAFKYQSSLKTWIYTIALNKAKDKIAYNSRDRRKANYHAVSIDGDEKNSSVLSLSSHTKPPDLAMEHNEDLLRLWNSINQLPLKQKEALILTKIDHNSMKETAIIMETTPKAIESLLSRGRTNLKKIIEQKSIDNG